MCEVKTKTLYLRWLRSRAKLFVAIVARFNTVFGVVFRKLLRWFVQRDRNFELSPTFKSYDFIKCCNGVIFVPKKYKCHSLLYRRGNRDVRVQEKEAAILISDKLHTTLDSPLPLFFFKRFTSFTSPNLEKVR